MSILIKGMDMPKQTEVQTDKGTLKLWNIRNWKVGQVEQFGAAKIPCDLSFNHDGTIVLDMLGTTYPLVEVPTPHGDLIDRSELLREVQMLDLETGYDVQKVEDMVVEDCPTIIEAEE